MENKIVFTVNMTEIQAIAYSKFLQRVGFSDYEMNADSINDAYNMQFAGECIQEALAKVGFCPR